MAMFPRSKLEMLKDHIDKLEVNEHKQIYNIMKKDELQVTKTQNGVLVSADSLSNETLAEVERYVLFCLDQRKRMDEDMKTRKTYERMVHD
uniref:NET domain-containing protein n=1 Tax=viral metagenome TaxID=1070528 RepID=A0A6C0JM34_9ZZZZ